MQPFKRMGKITITINGCGEDHGDTVSFPAIIAAEGIYSHDGSGKKGYRNAEETQKMIPFCNGLRLVEKHPPGDSPQFVGINFHDEDFPVLGYTANAHEAAPGPQGQTRIGADLHFYKVDRTGTDRSKLISNVNSGDLVGNSITYYFAMGEEEGEYLGEHYDFTENDVNPYTLGLMTDGWVPKCDEPVCGIGQSGEEGDTDMSDKEAPPDEGGKKDETPLDTKAIVADMCPDKIAEINSGVNALKVKVGELEKQKDELDAKLKEQEGAMEELEGFRKEKAAEEKAELEEAVAYMKERMGEEAYKVRFDNPETEGAVTLNDLKVEREYLDLIAPLPDTESEKKDETPEPEPEPGQNADKKSIWALRGTAGVKNEGKDKKSEPEPEDDELDGKLPVLS